MKTVCRCSIFISFRLEEREPRYLRTIGEFAEQATLKNLGTITDDIKDFSTRKNEHLERVLAGCLFLLVLVRDDPENPESGEEVCDLVQEFAKDEDLELVKLTEYVEAKQDHFMVRERFFSLRLIGFMPFCFCRRSRKPPQ